MSGNRNAFTIVELLIVIVVISILATITVVAFSGVQARAQNTSRLAELNAWNKLFEIYKGTYGSYPKASPNVLSQNGFCLGTGFKDVNGVVSENGGVCHDSNATVNVPLNNEIKKVGSLPTGIRTPTKSGAIGVYADYFAYDAGGGNYVYSNSLELVQVFDGNAACPSSTYQKYAYMSGSTVISRLCGIQLNE